MTRTTVAAGPGTPVVAQAPVVQVFPVAIGHYADLADLAVHAEVGRLVDLLAPFGGFHDAWAWPARERGADAVQRRLRQWGTPQPTGQARVDGSVLYWVGHGWSNDTDAALAHANSPVQVGANGVSPEDLVDAIRARRAAVEDGWVLVVVDTCKSKKFVELLHDRLTARDTVDRVLLVGVSDEGATTLGRFTDALRTILHTTYQANGRIPLADLAVQLSRLLPGCEVSTLGDIIDAALVPIYPPVASWVSAPLDTVRHLEDVLDDLTPDERRHFLVKAQGAARPPR